MSTETLSEVPVGRFTCLTRISNSRRLLSTSYSAKPFGNTPLTVAPVKAANKLFPLGDGEGEGETVGLGEGETVGETLGEAVGEMLGDGLGEPVGETLGLGEGEPVGETVGEGVVFPPLNTPFKIIVAPILTWTVEPPFTVGTNCPSSVLSLSLARWSKRLT